MRFPLLASFLSLVICVGCGSSDDTTPARDAGTDAPKDASDATTDVQPDGTTDAPSDTGIEAAPDVTPDVPDAVSDAVPDAPPAEPHVHFVGRHEPLPSGGARFGWSGTGFVVRFQGTAARVRMDDPSGFFTVVVDGQMQSRLETSSGEALYELATGLSAGEHVVEVYRRAEGFFGATRVIEVEIDGTLLPPPVVGRRIEVLGDSITCGYGNEGADQYCNFSSDTENHYQTYAAIAARALDAELSAIAWSGKGVIFNYGDDTTEPLPSLFGRTIPTEANDWGFEWQPDAVVINLGTNDFSAEGDPSESEFVGAYVGLLEKIRDVYPDARILCTVAPLLSEAESALVMGYIQQAVQARVGAGDGNVARIDLHVENEGWGCDWHPSIATHEAMAALLESELKTAMGW
jgi:lysophospholipase L1-like esterase